MPLVTVPPRSATGFTMRTGQLLRVVDPEGGQSGDIVAYRAGDVAEPLSNGRTFDYQGKIRLTTGDVLWSTASQPMFTIVDDDVGRHDFLYAACSIEMYRRQYGVTGDHPSCTENLTRELGKLGIVPITLAVPFNVFVNAVVDPDGAIIIAPPLSKAGDAIVLRAEMPLAVALSSCPAGACNGGTQKPLAYELLDG